MQVVPQRIWAPVMGEPPISLAGVRGRQEPSNNVAVRGRQKVCFTRRRARGGEGTAAGFKEAEEAQDPNSSLEAMCRQHRSGIDRKPFGFEVDGLGAPPPLALGFSPIGEKIFWHFATRQLCKWELAIGLGI